MGAIVRDSEGDPHLLIAVVRQRMSITDLECWAATGEKTRILALAKRLDLGSEDERDADRAERLYKIASTGISGTTYIYTPGFKGKYGRVISVRTGPDIPGLPEAAYLRALMHLEGRATRSSYRKGIKLLDQLAKDNYRPAQDKLATLTRVRT